MKRTRIAECGMRNADSDNPQSEIRNPKSGFTLIELMVSVALAIIILTLFATIYSWSTETYSTQKGIRRNDQRSRMMVTVIKGDLNNRTFKDVVPFWPGQDTTQPGIGPPTGRYVASERRGYFCISENDPDNQTDDVLFLTVEIPTDNSQSWYTGRAKALTPLLTAAPNQPEVDDGQFTPNDAGASRAAEVAYFLRNGNLYRRVLLIRDPYEGTDPQPTGIGGLYDPVNFFQGGTRSGIFWNDFSYSAYYRIAAGSKGVRFNGITALQNSSSAIALTDGSPAELGIPPLRFGYSLNRATTPPDPEQFLPREYVTQFRNANNVVVSQNSYIGRFLDQETSDPNFLYPGSVAAGDPHTRTNLILNRNPSDARFGVIEEYHPPPPTPPPHRGDDILMTNVHEFDIQVWDSQLRRFVQLGYDPAVLGSGDYDSMKNRNLAVRNRLAWQWNRFDTWHPFADSRPPTNPDNPPPLGPPPYKGYRTLGTATVPQLGANEDKNGNGVLDIGEDLNGNDRLDQERPLLAIQITIRFYDVNTKQMRQLTIQHSLRK